MQVLAAFLYLLASTGMAAETENVLVLFSNNRLLPANIEVDRGLREGIAKSADRNVEFSAEFLDQPAYSGQAYEKTLTTYLREKYVARPPAAIVVTGEFALGFLLRNRDSLFASVPLVFVPVDRTFLPSTPLPADVIPIRAEYDALGTIQLALRLHPHTRRLVVVTGTSDWDRNWESDLRSGLASLDVVPTVEFLAGLSTDAVVKRLSELGHDDVVFTPGYFKDGADQLFVPRESVVLMVAASAAPIYGPFSTFIGTGIVGGRMPTYADIGRQAARAVTSLLDGVPPANLPPLGTVPTKAQIDWRQARRWGIDADEIPGDAIIRFKEPSLLEAHQTEVIIALVVFFLQAALIVALLLEHGRRRTAEWESQKRYSEMTHLNRRVAMGELSASIAHELNQPLGAIHNNAGAAEMLIKANPPRLQEVAEILADIKRDDQRASDVIARIRKMLRKTEFEVRDLDLNETIDETMKMLLAELSAKGITLRSELEPGLAKVKADRVEVQQVILNLVLNAMDAMRDQPADKRVLTIRSRRTNGKEAEVSVLDSGLGIPGGSLSTIFDPFVTTKPGGMGLGLTISRTIVEAHGGQIRAESGLEGGTVIHLTLPFASAQRA